VGCSKGSSELEKGGTVRGRPGAVRRRLIRTTQLGVWADPLGRQEGGKPWICASRVGAWCRSSGTRSSMLTVCLRLRRPSMGITSSYRIVVLKICLYSMKLGSIRLHWAICEFCTCSSSLSLQSYDYLTAHLNTSFFLTAMSQYCGPQHLLVYTEDSMACARHLRDVLSRSRRTFSFFLSPLFACE
jgi:hypothetical protein